MEQPVKNAEGAIETIRENIPNIPNIPDTETIKNNVSQGVENITNTVTNATNTVKGSINEFSSQNTVSAGQEFLNSNSIIAKFAFVVLILVIFLILLQLGISIIAYFTKPPSNPYLVKGIVSGNSNIHISQNPKNSESVTILRSNNQNKGIEATWASWLLINDINNPKGTGATSFSHVFNKGNEEYNKPGANGVASVNNAPGLYVSDNSSNLRLYFDTISNNNNFIDINNIPLKKWFHIAIRIQNNIIDIYINGIISERQKLNEVPKQNYDDVHIGCNGGFNGQLSNLTYYDYALGIFEINNIILRGPNTTVSNAENNSVNYSYYLSNLWYSSQANN